MYEHVTTDALPVVVALLAVDFYVKILRHTFLKFQKAKIKKQINSKR